MSSIQLRDYQKEAVARFQQQEVGLFEMATGTGKTVTALSCVQQQWERDGRQFLVIIVPYVHLIAQWRAQFSLFDLPPAIVVAHKKEEWLSKLQKMVWYYTHHYVDRVILIGSYRSMIKPECQKELDKVAADGGSFLLADECHNIGQPSYMESALRHFHYRLGLSATPERWRDELGTHQVFDYFGEVIYQYSMKEAIANHFLTPYEYHPVLVDMTSDERKKYKALTKKISRLLSYNDDIDEEQLNHLLVKRSRLLKKAAHKIPMLMEKLAEQKDLSHTLIYCAEGEVDEIMHQLAGLGVRAHRFTSEVSFNEREHILQRFAEGEIEILVAIKCLDEGVDVPATQTAYFLASTTNPREFIQRRGRILRRSPGKKQAVIYDFMILPMTTDDESLFKSVAQKELPRFVEFSRFALNRYESRTEIYPLLRHFALEEYLELLPKEMLERIQQEYEEI